MPVFPLRPLVLLGLAGIVGSVAAAPMSSQEAAAQSAPPPSTALHPRGATGSDGGINAQTVDLLLRLQDRPNSFGSTPVPRTEGSAGARSGAAPVVAERSDPPVSKEALLELKGLILPGGSGGDGERSDRTSPRQALMDDARDEPVRSGPSSRKSSDEPWAAPRSTLFDSPVVRFIRENRYAVLGASVVLLAALWLTANVRVRHSSRRRR